MFKVIFGVCVVTFVVQIAGRYVVRDTPKFKYNNQEYLDMKKNKLGQWYALCDDDETYASNVFRLNFTEISRTKFSVVLCKFGCTEIDLAISHRNSGESFFTFDADYDNYAVIEAEENVFMVLSRNKFPDPGQFDKLATKYNIPFPFHTTK